jgi:hypothetical protein
LNLAAHNEGGSRLRRVLRRILGPKREEVTGSGENYVMRNIMFCTPHTIFLG